MKFIIISSPRSGTNLLRSYLNSHIKVECDTELVFSCRAVMLYLAHELNGIEGAERTAYGTIELRYNNDLPLNYYRVLSENSGFIMHYHQVPDEMPLSQFNVIHLVRKNVFERAVSLYVFENQLRGKKGNHFFKFFPHKIDFRQKFNVRRADLEHIINQTQKNIDFWKNKLQEDKCNHITIYYEDLFDDRSLTKQWKPEEGPVAMPGKTARKVTDFLKVEPQDMYSYFKRVNTPDYQNYITNWDEIKDLAEI